MNQKQIIGQWGENIAAEFYKNRGYTVLGRNVRTPYGELDLIVRNTEGVVFVEVKTRTNTAFGLPEDAVDSKKRAHLLDAARFYLQSNPEYDGDWRVDVIAISGRPGQVGTQVEWFENALS
jgi:putative endonuclease